MFRNGQLFRHAHHPILGILFMVLVVAALVLVILFIVRMWKKPHDRFAPFRTGSPAVQAQDPALTELRVRYARGEITWEEYTQRVGNLGYGFPPGSPPTNPSSGGQPPAAS